MKRIPNIKWDQYRKIISDFVEEDAGKKMITWRRYREVPTLFGEDQRVEPFNDIQIEVLVAYNTFRTWPYQGETVSGEWDLRDAAIYISKNYLKEHNLINSEGYMKIDSVRDRFIIDGITYRTAGDTAAAQASDQDILMMVIIQREEVTNQDTINP